VTVLSTVSRAFNVFLVALKKQLSYDDIVSPPPHDTSWTVWHTPSPFGDSYIWTAPQHYTLCFTCYYRLAFMTVLNAFRWSIRGRSSTLSAIRQFIKYARSRGVFGQNGFFRYECPNFLLQKNFDFSEIMVRSHGQRGEDWHWCADVFYKLSLVLLKVWISYFSKRLIVCCWTV